MKKKLITAVLACMVAQGATAWPWSTDMMNQPSIKPGEPSGHGNKLEMYPYPEGSLTVGTDLNAPIDREAARALKNPYKQDAHTLKEGRTLFRIYCSACHGLTGKADSPVSAKIGAPSLIQDYIQNYEEGWIFGTITFGSYIMPAYGSPNLRPDHRGSNDLNPRERWSVVNYVKTALKNEK